MIPDYRILNNGRDITSVIRNYLVSIDVTDETGFKSDSLTIVLVDVNTELEIPRRGARLSVEIGYKGSPLESMGYFIVDSADIEGPPDVITIQASGAAFMEADAGKAFQTRKTRSWDPQTLGSIVNTIATEHDVTPSLSKSASDITLPHIDQTDESDMHLLVRLSTEYDLVVKPAYGKLIVMTREDMNSPSGEALETTLLTPNMVSTYKFSYANKSSYNQIVTRYYDPDKAETINVTAGSGEPIFTDPNTYPDSASAQNAANSKLKIYKRSGATFEMTMPGKPTLVADGWLIFKGYRPEFDGAEWQILRATHSITPDSGGFTTSISGRSMIVNV